MPLPRKVLFCSFPVTVSATDHLVPLQRPISSLAKFQCKTLGFVAEYIRTHLQQFGMDSSSSGVTQASAFIRKVLKCNCAPDSLNG
jgi:hypothetical protein